jgi:hypothetical protein
MERSTFSSVPFSRFPLFAMGKTGKDQRASGGLFRQLLPFIRAQARQYACHQLPSG